MLRRYVSTALIAGSLVFGAASTLLANGTGVIAHITSVDARKGLATVTTDGGESFTLVKDSIWQIGTRIQCERVADTTPARLERCQLW